VVAGDPLEPALLEIDVAIALVLAGMAVTITGPRLRPSPVVAGSETES
jgi:hypothetical protein